MASAIARIREEHKDLAQVLRCLEMIVGGYRDSASRSDLELLASIIYYIQVFPDGMHHPKEESHLFPVLRARRPDLAPLLQRLHDQHIAGEAKIERVAEALKALESGDATAAGELKRAAEDYVSFQFQHIRLEEDEVLPAAEASLSAEDWRDVDAAFASNNDPMFGENMTAGFHALHDHIMNKMQT